MGVQRIEERVSRAPAVVAGSELDLERLGTKSDQLEDAAVLFDRVAGAARDVGESGVADAGEASPAAMHEIEQMRIGARLEQHRVEAAGQFGEGMRVKMLEHACPLLVDRLGLRERLLIEQGSRERCGCTLDEAESLHGVRVLALVDQRDAGADIALEGHETFGFETADPLALRHDAHVQLLRDRSEHETVPGAEGMSGDARADPGVRLLRLAGVRDGGHFWAPEPARAWVPEPARAWVPEPVEGSASYFARHSAFIGKSPSTGCP